MPRKPHIKPDLSTVGGRLAAARIDANLSRQDVAARLDMPVSTIGSHENSQTAIPPWDKLRLYLDVYGCSLDWIILGAGERRRGVFSIVVDGYVGAGAAVEAAADAALVAKMDTVTLPTGHLGAMGAAVRARRAGTRAMSFFTIAG